MRQHITDEFGNPSPNGVYGTALKKDIKKLHGSTVDIPGAGLFMAI